MASTVIISWKFDFLKKFWNYVVLKGFIEYYNGILVIALEINNFNIDIWNGAGLLLQNFKKDTDDYELYDPRIHSLRASKLDELKRGPILVNRPPKNAKSKQEVCYNRSIKILTNIAWIRFYFLNQNALYF